MSIIYRTITFLGRIKRETKKAKCFNQQEDNKLKVKLSNDSRKTKIELVNDELKNIKQDENLRVQKLNIKQEKVKGNIFLLFSLVSGIISALFSICGLNGVKTVKDTIKDVPSTMITVVFIFFAILNLIISYYETYHQGNYFKEYNKLKIFQYIFVCTSVTSNFMFLRLQGIQIALSLVLAVLLDMAGVFCSNIANAKKYKNKSTQNVLEKKASLAYMIQYIATSKFRTSLECKYNELLALQKNVKSNVKTTSNVENIRNVENMNLHELRRTSSSKITKEQLFNYIDSCHKGEIITPKMVNMQQNKNFYNWINECDSVQKIDGKYVKVS